MSSIYSIIDIGTVTCRLMIAKLDSECNIEVLHKQTAIVNLGHKVDETGRFNSENLTLTIDTIRQYGCVIESFEQKYSTKIPVRVVATSASRDAKNSHLLIESVKSIGMHIDIISGEMEAKMAFRGASLALGSSNRCIVLDIGGGSTEIIAGLGGKEPELFHSFNVGCRRITERFYRHDPPLDEEIRASRDFIHALISDYMSKVRKDHLKCSKIIAVAGTATTLVAIKKHMKVYDPSQVHGSVISLQNVEVVGGHLSSVGLEERKEVVGLQPQRADVIVAGMVILEEILHILQADSFIVSETDLLYGALLYYFAQ